MSSRYSQTYGAHERIEDADGERRTAGKRLRHVQLCVRVIVVVLVEKLHVRVVTCSNYTGSVMYIVSLSSDDVFLTVIFVVTKCSAVGSTHPCSA